MPVASLKMALSVGDTGKAFSQFFKNQVVRVDMNILTARKNGASDEIN